jgi:hypothetical protein
LKSAKPNQKSNINNHQSEIPKRIGGSLTVSSPEDRQGAAKPNNKLGKRPGLKRASDGTAAAGCQWGKEEFNREWTRMGANEEKILNHNRSVAEIAELTDFLSSANVTECTDGRRGMKDFPDPRLSYAGQRIGVHGLVTHPGRAPPRLGLG